MQIYTLFQIKKHKTSLFFSNIFNFLLFCTLFDTLILIFFAFLHKKQLLNDATTTKPRRKATMHIASCVQQD